ncbi:hypothetical protein ACT0WS_004401 [Salmonella enterica subsp. enterica serovar Montevideo]
MKLQKRITMNIFCTYGMDKRQKRRAFRRMAKEEGAFSETIELALDAARNWRR